jgi:hypothetical protein
MVTPHIFTLKYEDSVESGICTVYLSHGLRALKPLARYPNPSHLKRNVKVIAIS